MIEKQPSEEQELANAAYVYRKQIQLELVEAMRDRDIKLESAEWWFERYRRAKVRENIADAVAKGTK